MNAIISRPALLFLFLVFPVFLSGQIPRDQFTSGEYRFTIGLPAKPTESKVANFELLGYDVFGDYFRWNEVPGTFVSLEAYTVIGESPRLTGLEKAKVILEYKKANVAELKKLGALTKEAPFTFGDLKGTEVRGVLASGTVISRMFFVKDRLFVLSVSKSSTFGFDWHLEVLSSFRILTKNEYIAALIDENTPRTLPQAPRANRAGNDLTDEGLRGKVRSLVEDVQESPRSPRGRSSEIHYDTDGNLVKQIDYFSDYPSDVTVWGWIDGMRVSSFSFISYPFGEGPNEKGITSIMQTLDASVDKKERDPRYAVRYEFKYDAQSRIVEKKQYGNDGELQGTENVTYGPNTRTTEYNDDGGKTRHVETIDPDGQVMEEKYFGPKGTLKYSYSYKYELDPTRNWISRRRFEKKTIKTKAHVVAGPVYFRAISYYQ